MRHSHRYTHYRSGKLRLLTLLLIILLCAVWVFHACRPVPEQTQPLAADTPFAPPTGGREIRVLMPDGSAALIPLEEFLVGVVAAEMPASFAAEALKAQAIAARTYVLSHSLPAGVPRHEDADICCNSQHCQAYMSLAELRQRWGDNFDANYQAICRSISETVGQAIFYNGSLAETPYCSTCGGQTQAAADVWGKDVAYLQSVPCYWDAHSPRAFAAQEFSVEEAARLLAVKAVALPAMSASYSKGGAINQLVVGDKTLSGLQLRQVLGLDSAACQWLIQDGRILFTTRGFGHGVGLCQYGADGMAKAGFTAPQILTHYYQGTEVNICE